jgi:hypothetical protein
LGAGVSQMLLLFTHQIRGFAPNCTTAEIYRLANRSWGGLKRIRSPSWVNTQLARSSASLALLALLRPTSPKRGFAQKYILCAIRLFTHIYGAPPGRIVRNGGAMGGR